MKIPKDPSLITPQNLEAVVVDLFQMCDRHFVSDRMLNGSIQNFSPFSPLETTIEFC